MIMLPMVTRSSIFESWDKTLGLYQGEFHGNTNRVDVVLLDTFVVGPNFQIFRAGETPDVSQTGDIWLYLAGDTVSRS